MVVWEAANLMEAQVVKGRLESEGIPAFIRSEAAGVIYGITAGSLARADVLGAGTRWPTRPWRSSLAMKPVMRPVMNPGMKKTAFPLMTLLVRPAIWIHDQAEQVRLKSLRSGHVLYTLEP